MQSRQYTIVDIANRTGVAPSTVSRVFSGHPGISEKTRAKVLEMAEELGYVRNMYASFMRKPKSLVVGLIIPDVKNDFYSTMATVLAGFCRDHSFQMILCSTDDYQLSEEKQTKALVEARIAGIIIAPSVNPSKNTIKYLRSVPTVQVHRHIPEIGGQLVRMEESTGTRMATEHLLSLGHRRIAYVGTRGDLSTGADRLKGFYAAYAAAGLEPDTSLVALCPPRAREGKDAVCRMLSFPQPPSALILGSTEISASSLQALAEKGLNIPRDISIIGYGDNLWNELLVPPLTAIRLPIEDVAQEAANALFSMLGEECSAPSVQTFHTELVVRQSTARYSHSL